MPQFKIETLEHIPAVSWYIVESETLADAIREVVERRVTREGRSHEGWGGTVVDDVAEVLLLDYGEIRPFALELAMELSRVELDDYGQLSQSFIHFPAETPVAEVWQWLEKMFRVSQTDLAIAKAMQEAKEDPGRLLELARVTTRTAMRSHGRPPGIHWKLDAGVPATRVAYEEVAGMFEWWIYFGEVSFHLSMVMNSPDAFEVTWLPEVQHD